MDNDRYGRFATKLIAAGIWIAYRRELGTRQAGGRL
jgi:hypothetical protein